MSFLVDDSSMEDQDREFNQQKVNRKVLCRPVATFQTLTNQIQILRNKQDYLIIVQAGSENLQAQPPV